MAEKDLLSIDIGTYNIKIAAGRLQANNIVIDHAFMLPTPAHSYQDGKIIDPDMLKKAIANALESKKIKAKKAIFTVESTAIIRREIILPAVKPEELDTMVIYEVEQYLPIMLSEYVVEYTILEEFTEEGVEKYKILVAALPKTMAEDFLYLAKELKLAPLALDINSNSISKLFSIKNQVNNISNNLDKTIAFLDMGYNTINVVILTRGINRFSRMINLGGYDIDMNIANSFSMDTKQAENLKLREGGLNAQNTSGASDAMINEMIKVSVDGWIQEMQRLFQYYTSRSSENRIDEIYLYGGSSRLDGLPEYIKMTLNIPTYKINAISTVKVNRTAQNPQLEYYLNAIGAIIRK